MKRLQLERLDVKWNLSISCLLIFIVDTPVLVLTFSILFPIQFFFQNLKKKKSYLKFGVSEHYEGNKITIKQLVTAIIKQHKTEEKIWVSCDFCNYTDWILWLFRERRFHSHAYQCCKTAAWIFRGTLLLIGMSFKGLWGITFPRLITTPRTFNQIAHKWNHLNFTITPSTTFRIEYPSLPTSTDL